MYNHLKKKRKLICDESAEIQLHLRLTESAEKKIEIYSFLFTNNCLLMIYISLCTNGTLNNCKRTFKVLSIRKKGGDLWQSAAFFVLSHQRDTLFDVFVGHTHSSCWKRKSVYVYCSLSHTRETNKPRHKILEQLRNGNKPLEMVIKHFYAHWTATIGTVGLYSVFFFSSLSFSRSVLWRVEWLLCSFSLFGAFAGFFFSSYSQCSQETAHINSFK